jgi:mRNA-degrading endonuclease toxin of MazEF toxin-antitoxin module
LSIPAKYRQRQIYWLDDCEPLDGDERKDRPVIVLSSPKALQTGEFPLIVACTTHPRARDMPRFAIPTRQENPETGLPVRCWAVPRWYLPINPFRLKTLKGTCPEALFADILKAVLDQMDKDDQSAKEK